MRIEAVGGRREKRHINVLVDTGAQVNLVRKGLIREEHLRKAQDTVRLVTANGAVMEGGGIETELCLLFRKRAVDSVEEGEHTIWGAFYEADIQVDAIVSCPWIFKNKLAVIPHA